MVDVKCREVLETAAAVTKWKISRRRPQVGRGMALSYRHVGLGDANARMSLKPDGRISILTTYADTGTGAHTILCQMVAEVLDVPFSQVGLEVGPTDSFRSESGTGASRVTFVLGQAVLKAAAKLKSLLCERAAAMFGASSEQVVLKNGRLRVDEDSARSLSLAELAQAATDKSISLEVESYHAEHETPPEGVFAACVAEVYVDVATGQVSLRKLDTVHDVATILNPGRAPRPNRRRHHARRGLRSHGRDGHGGGESDDGEFRRIQDSQHSRHSRCLKPRWSAVTKGRRRFKVKRSARARSLRWRRPSPTRSMTPSACASRICRSPRKKFFARCRSAARKINGSQASEETIMGVIGLALLLLVSLRVFAPAQTLREDPAGIHRYHGVKFLQLLRARSEVLRSRRL